MDNIEQRIQKNEQRNHKVEQDKAWEISWVRKSVILVLTYLMATWVLYLLGDKNYWQNSLIPVIGYILSTLSVPVVKKYWLKYYYPNGN